MRQIFFLQREWPAVFSEARGINTLGNRAVYRLRDFRRELWR